MKIVMLGPQASGKGTQADLVADELAIPHISTGDILRKNIKDMTELGNIALSYINKGELVPDSVINQVIEAKLKERECENGFILDGYPRNIAQAEVLDTFTELDYAVEIHVSDKEAIKRISGRRSCEKCGAVFSIYQASEEELMTACKKCGGRLMVRDDDKPEAIEKRLGIYHNETEPVIDYYKKKGILVKINGEKPIQPITEEILKKIKS